MERFPLAQAKTKTRIRSKSRRFKAIVAPRGWESIAWMTPFQPPIHPHSHPRRPPRAPHRFLRFNFFNFLQQRDRQPNSSLRKQIFHRADLSDLETMRHLNTNQMRLCFSILQIATATTSQTIWTSHRAHRWMQISTEYLMSVRIVKTAMETVWQIQTKLCLLPA